MEANSIVSSRNEEIVVLNQRVEERVEEVARQQACIQDLERAIEQGLEVKNQDIECLNKV